jgi:hypothetical protein
LDFFVPVGPNDGQRVEILIKSWHNHVDFRGILHLVYHPEVKDSVIRLARAEIKMPGTIRAIPEFSVVSQYFSLAEWNSLNGWNKQQFLKLLSHTVVRTEWYCVCDATTFFLRRLMVADLIENGRFVLPSVDSGSNEFMWFDAPAIDSANTALGMTACKRSYIAEFAVWNRHLVRELWMFLRNGKSTRGVFDFLNSLPYKTLSEWCIYGSFCEHVIRTRSYHYRVENSRIEFARNYLSIENLNHPFYGAQFDFPDNYKIVSLQNRKASGYALENRQIELVRSYVVPVRAKQTVDFLPIQPFVIREQP